ncbi:hypothetical protein [Sorangium sp. So ce1000]|uniref:hypothetical protein n=1 Tax=Sorangium sp. So ce1000 TaxID=3133325 RepID=UPI003F63C01B
MSPEASSDEDLSRRADGRDGVGAVAVLKVDLQESAVGGIAIVLGCARVAADGIFVDVLGTVGVVDDLLGPGSDAVVQIGHLAAVGVDDLLVIQRTVGVQAGVRGDLARGVDMLDLGGVTEQAV